MAGLGVLCLYHSRGFAESDPWQLLAHFFAEITFCATFASLALIDLKTWILPDRITYPAALFFWGVAVSLGRLSWGDALAGAGLGFGSLAAIILVYKGLTGRDGMGWGDAKLLAVSGAFLGWQALPLIILLAAVQGLLGAVLLAATQTSLEPTEPYLPLEGEDDEKEGDDTGEGDGGTGKRSLLAPHRHAFRAFLGAGEYGSTLLGLSAHGSSGGVVISSGTII